MAAASIITLSQLPISAARQVSNPSTNSTVADICSSLSSPSLSISSETGTVTTPEPVTGDSATNITELVNASDFTKPPPSTQIPWTLPTTAEPPVTSGAPLPVWMHLTAATAMGVAVGLCAFFFAWYIGNSENEHAYVPNVPRSDNSYITQQTQRRLQQDADARHQSHIQQNNNSIRHMQEQGRQDRFYTQLRWNQTRTTRR
ncbi:hypothetical protein [Endozoicomonas sp. YOMI1]|uniref:hypothetical protein n=1 Tax=Endozoicomonas sp. YOMI1 TaxID=2828739 RepID=UPI002148B4CF|nr:hypothetical protein [Endozoicomonas sp. YOMI1]